MKENKLDTNHLMSKIILTNETYIVKGDYIITSLGRVFSLPRVNKKGQYLKFKELKGKVSNGYKKITLYNKTVEVEYLHRLVADAFIPNPDNKPTVDHINRDRLDNRVENLRWATYKEQSGNQGKASKPIYCMIDNDVLEFDSLTSCANELNLTVSSISLCLSGKQKSHKGYRFKYK